MMSDALVQQVAIILLYTVLYLDFLLEENGAYHPRRWQNSYDEQ
jgi:hypothetical protein